MRDIAVRSETMLVVDGTAGGSATSSIEARMTALSPYVLSILRIMASLLFLQHGLSKVAGFPVPGPPLTGLLVVAAILESAGSLMLLVGAWTRLVAVILSGEMAVAYFMAHAPKSAFPIANGGDAAILYCFVFLFIAFAGGGRWCFDRTVLRRD